MFIDQQKVAFLSFIFYFSVQPDHHLFRSKAMLHLQFKYYHFRTLFLNYELCIQVGNDFIIIKAQLN